MLEGIASFFERRFDGRKLQNGTELKSHQRQTGAKVASYTPRLSP